MPFRVSNPLSFFVTVFSQPLSEEELLTEELVNEPLLLTSIPPVPSFTFSLPDAIDLSDNAAFELQVDVENFGENDRVNVSVTSLNGFMLVGENGSLEYSLSDFPRSYTEDATQQITVSFEAPDDLFPGTMTDTLTFTMEMNTAE